MVYCGVQCGKSIVVVLSRSLPASRHIMHDSAHLGFFTDMFSSLCDLQVVHGLSVPLGKLGFWFPRTLSRTLTLDNENDSRFRIRERVSNAFPVLSTSRSRSRNATPRHSTSNVHLPIHRIGGTVIRAGGSGSETPNSGAPTRPETPPLPNRTIRFPDEHAD